MLAALAVGAAGSARAHPSPAAPYDRLRLVQAFGGERRMTLRARWRRFVGVPDPVVTGATVYVTTGPAPGAPAVIALPAAGWRSGSTRRFAGGGDEGTQAALRVGRRGGRFVLTLRRGDAPLVAPGTERVSVLVALADVRWCGEVSGAAIRESAKRLVGATRAALTACPCEPLPADAFAAIERRVFARHTCTAPGCHGVAPGKAGLLLAAGSAWASLVSVPSTAEPTQLRVAPGDPDASMLWRKLAARTLGLAGVPGSGMPIGDPVVGAAELEALRQWILAGAPATGAIPEVGALLDCALP